MSSIRITSFSMNFRNLIFVWVLFFEICLFQFIWVRFYEELNDFLPKGKMEKAISYTFTINQSVRPKPLRITKFVNDVHLGKLCKYLRILGFGTYYRNDLDDDEIIKMPVGENRIIHAEQQKKRLSQHHFHWGQFTGKRIK